MKRNTSIVLLNAILFLLNACNFAPEKEVLPNLTQYVNPFIGTGFHGHTFPGPTRPYALVQLSPDTHIMGWDASSGYHYDDSVIYAFSHTHLSGTGIGDLGDVALLPYSGKPEIKPVATFKKESEKASPGYYSVRLDNYGVKVELTSTDRVGFHKYSFDDPAERRVMLDLGHVLQPNWGHRITGNDYLMVNDSTVEGTIRTEGWAHAHAVSYRITFSEPFETLYQFIDGTLRQDSLFLRLHTTTEDVKFHYQFPESKEPLYVKVALSPVSSEGAENNMNTELSHWDFEGVRYESEQVWNKELNRIRIESQDPAVMINFYTALYHTMIAPFTYQDTDGNYIGMDKKVHRAPAGYTNYSVFSLWDTFRALHPLMTLIRPDLAVQWGEVLVQGYKEGTILPKWPLASNYTGCMVGYPAVSVLADLVVKDLKTTDLELWTEAAVRSSVYRADLAEKFKGTRELDLITMHPYYKEKYGFVPADSVPESVSWGLEMAYYDWCISLLAQKAGLDDIAQDYREKGDYYQRYLDPETKMMRGVMGDGSWRTPFNPRFSAHMKSDYTEGNAFQWSFFVPHAMDEFVELIGGRMELEARLDTLFTTSSQIDGEEASGDITGLIGQYAHGNEPSHHMAYLYNWTDSPWKGQQYIDYILREFYLPRSEGIIGNEDCGQMSAWYVMSALGFYQVCPGNPVYSIGRPLIDRAILPVAGGTFEILVKNNAPENKYVKEVRLNGKKLDSLSITHEDIIRGGKLEFEMSDTY